MIEAKLPEYRGIVEQAWPGNVRELENLTERLFVLYSDCEIQEEDLPIEFRHGRGITYEAPKIPSSGIDFNTVVEQLERGLILQALEHTHWNKNQAAQLLRLNRTTLEGKIRKRGLKPPS